MMNFNGVNVTYIRQSKCSSPIGCTAHVRHSATDWTRTDQPTTTDNILLLRDVPLAQRHTHTYQHTHGHRPADWHRHVQIVDPRNALILLRRQQNFVSVRMHVRWCRRRSAFSPVFPPARAAESSPPWSGGTQRSSRRRKPNITTSCSPPTETCYGVWCTSHRHWCCTDLTTAVCIQITM